MKLRNKKTGEIVEKYPDRFVINSGEQIRQYDSLAELNDEWEDYKEPFSTSFYTIVDGEIKYCIFYSKRVAGCPDDAWAYLGDYGRECIKQLKEVGLYFDTKEEAEKAVEKLKAWKRLKDKGFMFCGTDCIDTNNVIYFEFGERPLNRVEADESENDLDLLFSGGGE